jgi:hypothetical protein
MLPILSGCISLGNPVLTGMNLWLDGNDTSTITKAYQSITPTGTGTSGTTTITASATMANLGFIGDKIRIGGTDIYTISAISTTTITTVETLTNNYVAAALALDKESQVNDKSGHSNTAANATADTQPTYIPAIKNGKAFMGFDGTNDLLTVTSSSSIDDIFANGGTYLYVINPRSAGGGGNGRVFDKTRSVLLVSNFVANVGDISLFQSTTGTSWQWAAFGAINQNNYNIVIVTYNASTVATSPNIYVNSKTAASITVTTTGSGTALSDSGINYTLGNRAALDRAFNGSIGVAQAWKYVFSAAQITQAMSYYSNFYNISVT